MIYRYKDMNKNLNSIMTKSSVLNLILKSRYEKCEQKLHISKISKL